MSAHPPEHEELLRAVAVGELAPDAEDVRRRRAECGTCAARLDAEARAAALLDEEAAEERAILALAETMEDAPGEDRIAAFRDHPEFARPGGREPTRGPRRLWLGLAAAAVVVVSLSVAVFRGGAPDDPGGLPPRALGDDEIRAVEPVGDVKAFSRFAWIPDADVAERVRSYDLVVTGEGLLYEKNGLEDTDWTDPARALTWPDEIEWWVTAYDVTGAPIGESAPVSARRSP